MIRVSKEMLDIIRTDTSTENKKAQEVKAMMTKLEDTRRAHEKTLQDRDMQLSKIPLEA